MRLEDALPSVLLESVCAFLDHEDLHAVELSSRVFQAALDNGRAWSQFVCSAAVLADAEAPSSRRAWKHVACLLSRPHDADLRLLGDVVACSSVDRAEESPSNTLEHSQCWLALSSTSDAFRSTLAQAFYSLTSIDPGDIAQYECGCDRGRPCYWSTTPSTDKKTNDFLEYSVYPVSRIDAVQLIPYRAFWHPDRPTYGPIAASVAFYRRPTAATRESVRGDLIYQSPVYPLTNEMKLHECTLPKPVWLPNGAVMRLNLLGRHQTGTMENDTDNFYTTLSFVGVVGVSGSATSRHNNLTFHSGLEAAVSTFLERPSF